MQEEVQRQHDHNTPTRDDLPQLFDGVVAGLVQLGLTQAQARVYSTSLELGTSSARAIARKCSMDRGSTYHIIDELLKLDMLRMDLGTPNLYTPRNIDKIIQRCLDRYRSDLQSKVKTAKEIVTEAIEIKELRIHEQGKADPASYQLFRNRNQLLRESVKLWKDAKREILWVGPGGAVSRLSKDWLNDVFKKSCHRGVVWRLITEVNDTNHDDVRDMSLYCRIRYQPRVPMLMSIYDRKAVLFGATPRNMSNFDTDDEPHLLIEDPPTADAFTLLFESLWSTSSDLDLLPPELMSQTTETNQREQNHARESVI